MALTIEDGTGVADADSYITLAEARDYASKRGVTLPADDAELEILLIQAMDYLEAKRDRYSGEKTDSAQELQWPRFGAYLDGNELASSVIPSPLKRAEAQLAMEVFAGVDILPTGSGKEVIRQKVDVIETQYAQNGVDAAAPTLTKVEALLEPLYSSSGFGLTVKRA